MLSRPFRGSVPAASPRRADPVQLTGAIRAASVLFVAALTAAAAQISIPLPFTAVPFTFGPVVVLMGAFALGPRLGAASQVLYLAAGIAGLPVFAASPALAPGIARLFGPTGGYLLAYPLAAFVTGWLALRGLDGRRWTSAVAMLAGLVVIYAGGVSWLAWLAGPAAALNTGFYPFAIADLLKVTAASGLAPALRKAVSS
jgi:biotin transport system substrate-specific component